MPFVGPDGLPVDPDRRAQQRRAEGRLRWSHESQGVPLIVKPDITVVPYERVRGGWYCVVVDAPEGSRYPRGGYNIVVDDDSIERAPERTFS